MGDNSVEVKVNGDASGAEAAMAKAAIAVASGATTMKESFNALNSVFEGLQSKMLAVAAILAGGKAFKESVDKVVDLTKEAVQLSNALGISADEANVLNTALGNVFLDKDTYIAATKQITKQLNGNADAFKDMGIATKDAQGKLLPMGEIIKNSADALLQYKAGADRNVMANQLLGRSYEDVLKLAKLTPAVMADAAEEVAQYHKTLDPAVVLKYRQAMENVGDVFEGIQVAIGKAVMPVLIALGEWFSSIGPGVVNVFYVVIEALSNVFIMVAETAKMLWDVCAQVFSMIGAGITAAFGESSLTKMQFFTNVLKVVELAFLALQFGIEGFVEGVKTNLDVVSTFLFAFADTATHALKLDFSGAKAAWNNGLTEVENVIAEHANNMVSLTQKYAGKANEIIMPSIKSADSSNGESQLGGTKSATDKKEKKSEKTNTGDWATQLANEKEGYELSNNLRKYDIQNEINFWQQKLALTSGSGKEYQEVLKKINDAKLKQAQESMKQMEALSLIEIGRIKAAGDAQLGIDEQNAKAQLALGNISKEQYIELEQQFEDRRFAIAKAAIDARKELMLSDPNSNPEEKARINAQMEALEQEHASKTNAIQIESVQESQILFQNLSDSMSNLWDKGIESMMNGTFRWANAYKAVIASVGKVFIQFAAQKAKAWLQTEVLQTVYTRAQTLIRTVLEKAGLIQSVTATATAAETKVGANAIVAGTGAASAMAGIPYIGPILAIAAMAAMIASVSGMKGSIKSARNGYDIPAGVNPMVQLHESEMVLPKAQADAVRNMADGGGSGGGQVNVTIHAVDSQSVRKLFMDHGNHLADAMRQQFRNGGAVPK